MLILILSIDKPLGNTNVIHEASNYLVPKVISWLSYVIAPVTAN